MPPSLRDLWTVIVLGCILFVGAALYFQSQKIKSLESKAQDSTAQAAAYKAYATEHAKVNQKKEESRVITDEVLDLHRDWADLPVPDDVADRLRDHKPTR